MRTAKAPDVPMVAFDTAKMLLKLNDADDTGELLALRNRVLIAKQRSGVAAWKQIPKRRLTISGPFQLISSDSSHFYRLFHGFTYFCSKPCHSKMRAMNKYVNLQRTFVKLKLFIYPFTRIVAHVIHVIKDRGVIQTVKKKSIIARQLAHKG